LENNPNNAQVTHLRPKEVALTSAVFTLLLAKFVDKFVNFSTKITSDDKHVVAAFA